MSKSVSIRLGSQEVSKAAKKIKESTNMAIHFFFLNLHQRNSNNLLDNPSRSWCTILHAWWRIKKKKTQNTKKLMLMTCFDQVGSE